MKWSEVRQSFHDRYDLMEALTLETSRKKEALRKCQCKLTLNWERSMKRKQKPRSRKSKP